jgi:hypothetical protein
MDLLTGVRFFAEINLGDNINKYMLKEMQLTRFCEQNISVNKAKMYNTTMIINLEIT